MVIQVRSADFLLGIVEELRSWGPQGNGKERLTSLKCESFRGQQMQTLSVKTDRRTQLLDVTRQVQKAVSATKIANGICYLYVPHTTAAIAINECADPDVAQDIAGALDRLVPAAGPYRHAEGNSDSHVKTVLSGTSLNVFVEEGKLVLGRWQGIFFCEYDGPRDRKLLVKVAADHV